MSVGDSLRASLLDAFIDAFIDSCIDAVIDSCIDALPISPPLFANYQHASLPQRFFSASGHAEAAFASKARCNLLLVLLALAKTGKTQHGVEASDNNPNKEKETDSGS